MIAPFRPRTGPLIVFLHVPKAAGSTVNRHLRAWSRRGLDHIERFRDTPDRLARKLPRLDWVSGHLAQNRMLDLLARVTGRDLLLFGTVRDPVAQVASQYNWQIEIFHRSHRFYMGHPAGIRAISERIRAADNTDPDAIIDILHSHSGLFLNLQSRFLLGDDIDLTGPDHAPRLARFSALTTAKDLPSLVQRMTGAPARDLPRQNTSPYHFDPSVFREPKLLTFLGDENSHDSRLFAQISAEQAA